LSREIKTAIIPSYILKYLHRRPHIPNVKPITEPEIQRKTRIPTKGNEISGLSNSKFSIIAGKYNPVIETRTLIDRQKIPAIKQNRGPTIEYPLPP
jgi:hypothetical protein